MSSQTPTSFELFVVPGFSEFELAAITHTLAVANTILDQDRFSWRFVSNRPGIVSGAEGLMVRAEPAIDDYGFSDLMIVVGGRRLAQAAWMKRARAMQRLKRPVVLLSDAATTYIISTKPPSGSVTTHWRDATLVSEAGYHPEITGRLAENSDGIITCAGAGGTAEMIIGLLARYLESADIAELGNRLILPQIRSSDASQPNALGTNTAIFNAKVTEMITLMEDALADPLSIPDLADQVGISARQAERLFRASFNETPGRFYKRLRTKHARAMIEETLIPLVEVAVATGFGSADTLSKAIKDEYGLTPAKMRARQKVEFLKFQTR